MEFYSCSESASDLASRGECALTSAIFEMETLAKHHLKKTSTHSCLVRMLSPDHHPTLSWS